MSEQSEKDLFQDAMRATEILLGRAKEMSTLYSRIECKNGVAFGININRELMNAIGDILNAHDAHDEDDPDNDFIDSVFERLAERLSSADEE